MGQKLTLTLTASNGSFKGMADADSTASGTQVTGTVSEINSALTAARFVASADGAASIAASLSDGIATAVTSSYSLTAANALPTLSTINTLTGGTEDLAYTIAFKDLLNASNATDNGGKIEAFDVTSVSSGTLTIGGSAWNASSNHLINADKKAVWTPAANQNGVDSSALSAFSVKAVDNQSVLSSSAVTVKVAVAAVNDAPVLTAGSYSYTSVDENTATAGQTVATLLGGGSSRASDVEGSTIGIAVSSASGNGKWQYSTDGSTWTDFGSASTTASLLLSNSTQVRYQPDGKNGESSAPTLTFRAWDGSDASSVGSKVDTTETGGATAFSSVTNTASVSVTAAIDPIALTLSSAASAGVTYTENATQKIDASLILSEPDTGSTLSSARISIGAGFQSGEDRLGINGQTSGTLTYGSAVVTYSYNTSTGILKLDTTSGTTTGANYQDALRQVTYWNTSDNPNTTARSLAVNAGDKAALFINGEAHFYEYKNNSVSWTTASSNAHSSNFSSTSNTLFGGLTGYLATVTTASENSFIANQIMAGSNNDAWLGATDSATENTWKWATDSNSPQSGTAASNPAYTNWDSGQPDNHSWITSLNWAGAADGWMDEDYAIINGASGKWNDKPNNGSWTQPTGLLQWDGSSYNVDGYVVEYSSASASFAKALTLTPQQVNDAPVLLSATPTLTTINEDATGNTGQLISSFIIANNTGSNTITDVDTGAVRGGIAITSINSGNGTWQYKLDGTSTWINAGTVDATQSLLLRPADSLRFLPNAENATSPSFTYRAWDQSSGAAGSKVDTSTNGGITAFSSASNTASITVSAVNDAPTLDGTHVNKFASILMGDTSNAGQKVSSLLGDGAINDVDLNALQGIAITGSTLITGTGKWQYSTNGTSWSDLGSVSESTARLLRASDLVRFLPDNANGGPPALTFRAWDTPTGPAG